MVFKKELFFFAFYTLVNYTLSQDTANNKNDTNCYLTGTAKGDVRQDYIFL